MANRDPEWLTPVEIQVYEERRRMGHRLISHAQAGLGYKPYGQSRTFNPVPRSPAATDLERLQAQDIVGEQLREHEDETDAYIASIPTNDGKLPKPQKYGKTGPVTHSTEYGVTTIHMPDAPLAFDDTYYQVGSSIDKDAAIVAGHAPAGSVLVNIGGVMRWEQPEGSKSQWNPDKWQEKKPERKARLLLWRKPRLLKCFVWAVQYVMFGLGAWQLWRSFV